MRLPAPPRPAALARLSYSQYESGRACLARLAWTASHDRPRIPESPGALLGTAFHAVIREAHQGRFSHTGSDDLMAGVRAGFDATVRRLWEGAHPLVRLKFPAPQHLPFYNIKREQAAALAVRAAAPSTRLSNAHAPKERSVARVGGSERWIESKDGVLYGRADYLDEGERAIIDYKSGLLDPASSGTTEAEGRQLRFYGLLAMDAGVSVTKGVIARAGGSRVEIPITSEQANEEGNAARAILSRYNAAVQHGDDFVAMASPSSTSCAHCDCIPFCEEFWSNAEPSWVESCGTHVEGTVRGVSMLNTMGVRIAQIRLTRTRGTLDQEDVALEQVPTAWLELGSGPPAPGQVVRVTDCRPVRGRPGVLRADKAGTAIWGL